MTKLQCWLFRWLQKMEQQSIERGLSGEKQHYVLENKKYANKSDRRKQVTRNYFFIKGRKSVNFYQSSQIILAAFLISEKNVGTPSS